MQNIDYEIFLELAEKLQKEIVNVCGGKAFLWILSCNQSLFEYYFTNILIILSL